MTNREHGKYLFDGEFALNLFGATLEDLTSDANFSASRRAFEKNAKLILDQKNDSHINLKLQVISNAFDDVGIRAD